MRCKACNKRLSDQESILKDTETGEYYDLCTECFNALEKNDNLRQIFFDIRQAKDQSDENV